MVTVRGVGQGPGVAARRVLVPYRMARASWAFRAGLPVALRRPVRFLATGALPDERVRSSADQVEAVRAALARRTGDVPILRSPPPRPTGEPANAEFGQRHGELRRVSYRRVAEQASVSPRWGTFLLLCAEACNADTIVEFGACAGLSAGYLAAAGTQPRVVTVEGSAELAALARETAARLNGRVEVVHALFDDALDRLLPTLLGRGVGLAWIDGEHERSATIRYFRRIVPALRPGSFVLFDDVSWSPDMRLAWAELARWPGFSDTVDLGRCGLGIWAGDGRPPRRWDLRSVGVLRRRSVRAPDNY
jgi:predicted O-methyltransferase YrrM